MNTYSRLPVVFEMGEGVWLWDKNGKRYLDGVAGVAVNGLGHGHPQLTRALCEQTKRLIHSSNLYRIEKQEELATRLCQLSGMDNVFFCNSGAEANEAAIKLARLHGHNKEIENPAIVVMERSFHGRTMATLSASGSRRVQAGFEPLLGGFVRVPFNDVPAIEQVAAYNPNIVAVLMEVLQGEGGIQVAHQNYLSDLRRLCDERGWLLMIDEVQSGIARTGAWFAHQHANVRPDVMTLAKGLGSGVPIGACLAMGEAATVFKPGTHGSTFGGNPLACTAALETLKIIEAQGLITRARELGLYIRQSLGEHLDGIAGVKEIRGDGLMIGIELDRPCAEIVKLALAEGLLINVTVDTVIRLLPPLIMEKTEAQLLVEKLSALIKQFLHVPVAH